MHAAPGSKARKKLGPSTVVIPRVAVEQRKGTAKTNSSASATSGRSGAEIEVQVEADAASAL